MGPGLCRMSRCSVKPSEEGNSRQSVQHRQRSRGGKWDKLGCAHLS